MAGNKQLHFALASLYADVSEMDIPSFQQGEDLSTAGFVQPDVRLSLINLLG